MAHLTDKQLDRAQAYEASDEEASAINEYRECAITMLAVMRAALDYIQSAKTKKEQALRVDVACWYFCLPDIAAMNLTDIAKRHGRHRATASAQLSLLEKKAGLPAQVGQKLKAARKIYQERARIQ